MLSHGSSPNVVIQALQLDSDQQKKPLQFRPAMVSDDSLVRHLILHLKHEPS